MADRRATRWVLVGLALLATAVVLSPSASTITGRADGFAASPSRTAAPSTPTAGPPSASRASEGSPAAPGPSTGTAGSTLEARYSAIAEQVVQRGVPARWIHLPSADPATVSNGAVVPGPLASSRSGSAGTALGYASEPAPAGIAYYGESGSDAAPTPTVLDTSSLAGTLNVTNLTSLYLDSDDPDQWGAQLNAVLTNVTLWGSDGNAADGYAFWTQNVIGYQGFNDTIQFVENTWNFTDLYAEFPSEWTAENGTATVVANDTSDTLIDGELYLGGSPFFYAPTPFNLTLYTNLSLYNPLLCAPSSSLAGTPACADPSAAVAAYAGDQTLFYNYSLSFPSSNTKVAPGTHYTGNYGWLTFHTSASGPEDHGANHRSAGFEASGYQPNAIDLSDDFELDVGIGAFDGANQNVFNGAGTASLDYVADCTAPSPGVPADCTPPADPTYLSVPAALNFGSETGETATGLSVNYVTSGLATFSAGPLNLHPLWGYGASAGVVAGSTPVRNGIGVSGSPLPLTAQPYLFIFLDDTSVTGTGGGYAWAPDVPVWYLMPGDYAYEVMLADYAEQTGSFVVANVPVTLNVTLPYSAAFGVYTPLWAVTPTGAVADLELAGISSAGNGSLDAPYVLFDNGDPAPEQALEPAFDEANDYSFPTFAGVLLWNTSAYVLDTQQVEFNTGDSLSGSLQQQFYETEHVTISATAAIRGWGEMRSLDGSSASQNPLPQASVMLWNSTDDLVMSSTFVSERPAASGFVATDALLLSGGGAACTTVDSAPPGPPVLDPCGGLSGPAPAGSQNVVWGNEFCDVSCSDLPSAPGAYAGLAEAEAGDLIYNNEFAVDNPAPFLPYDLETELGPVSPVDTWNVTEQPAAVVVHTVNGFPLSGNILDAGGAATYVLQGGNHWWNYGGPAGPRCPPPHTAVPGCLNAASNASYVNQFDYTDGAASLFPPPYDTNDRNGLGGAGDESPIGGFAVTFREKGLPGGTAWSVNVSLPGTATPAVLSSTAPAAASIFLADGAYPVSVTTSVVGYAAAEVPTSVLVKGVAQSVLVVFSRSAFEVTFREKGLPAGTEWWVNVSGGGNLSSNTTMLRFFAASGVYSFTVATVDKQYAAVGGTFTVHLGSVARTVKFTLERFAVTFEESGLPTGAKWCVAISGAKGRCTTKGTLTLLEPNGTYAFGATTPRAGYVGPEGSFTVAGVPTSVSVTFST